MKRTSLFSLTIRNASLAVVCLVLACDAAQTTQSATQTDLLKQIQVYEDACVLSLRLINDAQGLYWGGDQDKGYARTLRELGPSGAALLEPVIASGKKDWYRYRLVPERATGTTPVKHYSITATPIKWLAKNQRSFFTDESGIIRSTNQHRSATSTDPPIETSIHASKKLSTPSMRRPVSVKSSFCFFPFFVVSFFKLFPLSQAASVATLPSALFVERLSLGASWVYLIQ